MGDPLTEDNLARASDEQRLALPPAKVAPLGRDERLSGPEQAELYRRTPVIRMGGPRELLRVILTVTAGRRRLFATRERLMADTGMEWRTLKRHRAALVAAGILEPRGGGSRGRGAAVYWIRTGPEADEWVAAEAERRERDDAGGCPLCGEDPAGHTPRRCPLFGRPIQERLDISTELSTPGELGGHEEPIGGHS
jgi:hypothetical protein